MVLKTNSDLGEVTISNSVVAEIAGAVASECGGVVGMASRNKKDGIVKLLKNDSITRGIKVDVEDSGVVVEIHIVTDYGVNIRSICKNIVNTVRMNIENSAGIKVNRVNVRVEGVRTN